MKEQRKDSSSKEVLRERIIKQALDDFAVHGIKSIRMDDIANALKISKRTLYETFADKETLLRECILYHQATSRETLKELVANSTNVLEVILKCYQASVEAYHRVNKAFFEDMKKYPKVYELLRNNKEKDNDVAVNFLQQGVEQGLFRNDINFAILHAMLSEQMESLMNSKLGQKYDFLEVYESIMFIYLRGISTEKGAKELEEFIKEYRTEKSKQRNQENQDNKS
ncbi:TetR/AcrR family transcriptional regulator [Bacteroides sp. 224]|uniref:TetR/AcrR family transcriptional regulator n=1 Tax=Bacteroides sp. 224 TaxID=2302936 RepID=UPI0013D28E95|nr:TetR/AcrR family transcriptional regulator [Bacteroides sp. 224]NDV63875.1 TetR/AcrR family transcriptional regulator [Bacteroides sp. 224]